MRGARRAGAPPGTPGPWPDPAERSLAVGQPTDPNPIARLGAAALALLGLAVTVASVFADQLNLTAGGVGLGWKQLIGVIVGLVLLLGGAALLVQPPGRARAGD